MRKKQSPPAPKSPSQSEQQQRLERAHLRGRLEYGNESLAIADIDEDFHEVLHITQNLSGIPPFKLRVFREVFLPLYESKDAPNKSEDDKQEKVIALTTKELCEHYKKEIGKTITTDSMKTYLDEFLDNDLIDEVRSELDHRQNIYFPLVDHTTNNNDSTTTATTDNDDQMGREKISKLSNAKRFDNILQHQNIMVSKNCNKIPNNWLELQIFALLKCRIQLGEQRRFELYDKHGERVCICRFVKDYHTHNLIRYFSRPIFYNSSNRIFGDIVRLTTTTSGICEKLSNEDRFDNLDIFGQTREKESEHTLGEFKHPLSLFNLPSPSIKNQYLVMSGGANPLETCQLLSTRRIVKLDLLDRYGLDVEFDDGRDGDELGFTVANVWSVQEVIIENIDIENENKRIETICLACKTGHFSLPINSSSPADLVTMIAAVAGATMIISAPQQQQQLVDPEFKPPSTQPQLLPPPASLVKNVPELGRLAAFDCEWYRDEDKKNQEMGTAGNIYAFCLVDSQGNEIKLHSSYFDDRRSFMSTILDVIERYDSLAAYDMFSNEYKNFYSDIDHIKWNCNRVGLSNRFSTINSRIKFLDAGKIFFNNAVKSFLKLAYEVDYRENGLDNVAKEYLGPNKGKPEGISGANVESLNLTPDERLDYCLQDARLCYELIQKNDFELLQIMYEISQETNLPFFDTCNAGYPTTWWKVKLDSIGYQRPPQHVQRWIDENMTFDKSGKKTGVKYPGAYVAKPKLGYYSDAVSYDVSSMYPTMSNIHNISTETINCGCCDPNDRETRVDDKVMLEINDYVTDEKNKAKNNEPRPWHYWICKRERGKLADVMKNLTAKKLAAKESGNKLQEKAIKIFMNSGYGCFGQSYFSYLDPRVAELITSFGRYTLKQLFESVGGEDKVLYGDTDSIYLPFENGAIVSKANRLDVRLEVDRRWKILFLTPNKKAYFGLTEKGKLVYKTLTGMKSNQPAYFDKITRRIIKKEVLESFVGDCNNPLDAILEYLRSAFVQLEICDINELFYSQKASKNLYDYKNDGIQQQIYKEILQDCGGDIDLAQSQSQSGNVYEYWKIIERVEMKTIEKVTIHPEKYELNISRYRKELFKCVEPILQAYGIPEIELDQLRNELTSDHQQKRLIM
jgi:DNA polymerase elongation subunit (family B)